MNEFFNKLIKDEKLLKDLRLWGILILPFLMAIIYWAWVENFSFDNSVAFRKMGALTLIYYISNIGLIFVTNDRVFDEVYSDNEEWQGIEKEIVDNKPHPHDQNYGLDFTHELNVKGQKEADKVLTHKEIYKLTEKVENAQNKGKTEEVTRINGEIELLKDEANYLHNKKFNRYKYSMISSVNNSKLYEEKEFQDADAIVSNPQKRKMKRTVIFAFFRAVGFGGALGMGIAWGASLMEMLGFFATILFMQTTTIGTVTKNTIQYIKEHHISIRRNKLSLMKDLGVYILERKNGSQTKRNEDEIIKTTTNTSKEKQSPLVDVEQDENDNKLKEQNGLEQLKRMWEG